MMADVTLFEFDRDAGERLGWLLTQNGVNRPSFSESIKTAGCQLEWLKPSVIGGSSNQRRNPAGLYAGPAVMLKRSSVIILLAHKARVMTFHAEPREKLLLPLREQIDGCVDYARKTFAGELRPQTAASVMEIIIDEFGGGPGENTPSLDAEHSVRLLGTLFASLSEHQRAPSFASGAISARRLLGFSAPAARPGWQ
jgi:hypothetical protein